MNENDFWQMTIAEITRVLQSRHRVMIQKAQDKATFDYIQAELIGRSVARIYSNNTKFPTISEIYPNLFSSEELEKQQQAKRDELSIIRFKQFTQAHNEKFKGVNKEHNE